MFFFFNFPIDQTGLSHFHKLVLSVFKVTLPKSKPKEITYRYFNNFNQEKF